MTWRARPKTKPTPRMIPTVKSPLSGRSRLRVRTVPELEEYPDWSPDGKRIAYTVANSSIWVMDADGTNKRRVTEDHFFTAGSQWRPVSRETKYTQE